MRSDLPTGHADSDRQNPAKKRDGWFATFTFLDFSGALGSSELRRLGAAISKVWHLTLRSVCDRSKSRTLGV